MTSELQCRHCPPKHELAKIERAYQKALCQKTQQAGRVKSRKGLPFILRIGILERFPGFRSRQEFPADRLAPDEVQLGCNNARE
jgi:hypothetical protein